MIMSVYYFHRSLFIYDGNEDDKGDGKRTSYS